MAMTFFGKWTLTQANADVQVDLSSGVLSVAAPPSNFSDRFNAYGSAAAFVLQAANGLYVVSAGTGYAATKAATDPINQFTLESDGAGNVRVVDLGVGSGGATRYYWNTVDGALNQLVKAVSPPATTLFVENVVTPGLATILAQGFDAPEPDLTWVDLSGTDFSQSPANLDFTKTTLVHADLSHTTFSQGTAFDKSKADYAKFVGAKMQDCSIGSATCTYADFTKARLDGIEADSTDFSHATLTEASFNQAINLAHAKFIDANAQSVDFRGTANIVDTNFAGANLTNAKFTGSSVTGTMTITGANLTGAALNNPGGNVTIYPGYIVLDRNTNFTGALLQYIDFSKYTLSGVVFTGADMTACDFHGATLTGAELSYATLDNAKFTGTVLMNGANLSNASMRDADLTNAQLGALSSLFSVGSGTPNYAPFLTALQNGEAAGVQSVFAANGYTLSGTVTITPSRFSSTTWTVQASAPTPRSFTVERETVGGALALDVYTPTSPAVLSNAFMVNVNLTGANLIGVNASGAAIYGISGHNPNLNSAFLQNAQFSNANLGNADFSSAHLGGVNFDYAILTSAVFQNAELTTSGDGTRASFASANLQGANFDGATLNNIVFTNAAVSVANPANPVIPAGTWLFSLSPSEQALILPELRAAAAQQFSPVLDVFQQLQTPGKVGTAIVRQFQSNGITLTSDAILTIMGESIYWQVTDGTTQYVISRSFDANNYVPALGVAAGDAYSTDADFFLPLSLEAQLRNGPADPAVIAAFKTAGYPISSAAQLTAALYPSEWQVINGAPGYAVYAMWLGVTGNGLTLTARPSIPNLIAAFYNTSIALSSQATVTALPTNNGWAVSNDSEDPYNPVTNYIVFNLIQSSAGPLNVYGAVMRIARYKTPADREYYNIPSGITQLTQAQMASPGNVCPNGDFATTNQTNKLAYEHWLRARVSPRPPLCVPDPQGMYFCPI